MFVENSIDFLNKLVKIEVPGSRYCQNSGLTIDTTKNIVLGPNGGPYVDIRDEDDDDSSRGVNGLGPALTAGPVINSRDIELVLVPVEVNGPRVEPNDSRVVLNHKLT